MKRNGLLLITCLLLLLIHTKTATAATYCLGEDDTLTFQVWGYEDLQAEKIPIGPDGNISLPLVGTIQAKGLTLEQLTTATNQKLAYYLKNPQASFTLNHFRGKKIYVLGEVNKPGRYTIKPDEQMVEAISYAGGITGKAYWTKVAIVSKDTTEEQQLRYADLGRVFKKGDLSQNASLEDGDIVFVPENNRQALWGTIMQIISSVNVLNDTFN